MASSWIIRRAGKRGPRYLVRFRLGGAGSRVRYAGSFPRKEDALTRKRWVDGELAAMRVPNVELLVIYGSTEAEPVAHVEAAERLAARSLIYPKTPGFCAGVPVRQLGAKVIRFHEGPIQLGPGGWMDWELPAGEIGELVVCG